MLWFVYILETSNWRYYIWSTNDVSRRLKQHQDWKSLATRNVRPVRLLYSKEYQTLKEARQVEHRIKQWKDKSMIQKFMETLD